MVPPSLTLHLQITGFYPLNLGIEGLWPSFAISYSCFMPVPNSFCCLCLYTSKSSVVVECISLYTEDQRPFVHPGLKGLGLLEPIVSVLHPTCEPSEVQ
jgi:hypothetical protein